MSRPKISIPPDTSDYLMEGLSLLGLALLFALPLFYYNQLAEIVPAHFGIDGKPDAWGGKNNIWLLPGIAAVFYLIMTAVARIPERLNYAVRITAENAGRQYQNMLKLNRSLKLFFIGAMAYFMFWEIQIALGKTDSLGALGTYGFIVGILFLVGFYIYRSLQMK